MPGGARQDTTPSHDSMCRRKFGSTYGNLMCLLACICYLLLAPLQFVIFCILEAALEGSREVGDLKLRPPWEH